MIDVTTSNHFIGDCRELLDQLPDACVQTCVTSPPYWGLRDYGHAGQLGLEETPELFVEALIEVFRKVRRVMRDDGTLWLNLGDSYAGTGSGPQGESGELSRGVRGNVTAPGTRNMQRPGACTAPARGKRADNNRNSTLGGSTSAQDAAQAARERGRHAPHGLKPKDLVGIPWKIAFALRDDGWWLRQDIIWSKPNPMPESVVDRCTKAHEYIFLLSKSERYYYDQDAIREPQQTLGECHEGKSGYREGHPSKKGRTANTRELHPLGGNKRSVWTIPTQPYDGAHFATFPSKLIEPCILAGSRVGDLVLDPFFGSGTTGEVAENHGRRWIGFDLGYGDLAKERTAQRSLMGRFR